MTAMPIRWDRDRHQWAVYDGTVKVAAFDRLWEAERFVCAEQDRRTGAA